MSMGCIWLESQKQLWLTISQRGYEVLQGGWRDSGSIHSPRPLIAQLMARASSLATAQFLTCSQRCNHWVSTGAWPPHCPEWSCLIILCGPITFLHILPFLLKYVHQFLSPIPNNFANILQVSSSALFFKGLMGMRWFFSFGVGVVCHDPVKLFYEL